MTTDKDRIRVARERKLAEAESQGDTARADRIRAALEKGQAREPVAEEPEGLAALNKTDLLELAEAADVAGRSQMTKAELIEALEGNV